MGKMVTWYTNTKLTLYEDDIEFQRLCTCVFIVKFYFISASWKMLILRFFAPVTESTRFSLNSIQYPAEFTEVRRICLDSERSFNSGIHAYKRDFIFLWLRS